MFRLIFILLPALLLPSLAQAQETTTSAFSSFCSREGGLGTCIANIYTLSLGIAALLAVFMIILAGYKYMTAHGNASQTQDAKDHVTSALIGLLIIFTAFILLSVINPDLVRFQGNFGGLMPLPGVGGGGGIQTGENLPVPAGEGPVILEFEGEPHEIKVMGEEYLAAMVDSRDRASWEPFYRWEVIAHPLELAPRFNPAQGQINLSFSDAYQRVSSDLQAWLAQGITSEQALGIVGETINVRLSVGYTVLGNQVVTDSREVQVQIVGVWPPPVPVIRRSDGGPFGTLDNPLPCGDGVTDTSCNYGFDSFDTIGESGFGTRWGVGQIVGPGVRVVIFGSWGLSPGYQFSNVTQPAQVEIILRVYQGLYEVDATEWIYIAPAP